MSTRSTAQRILRAYDAIAAADRPEIWITLLPRETTLEAAVAVDARVAAGEALPLAGLTFAVKDNIDVAGLPTTAGHPGFAHVPERTATAVARLLDAGAVLVGKTNLDQFATGLVGTRSPYGAVRSSDFPDRVSGGSSSGSAVAVALGMVDFALGTDTAGSGRVPAALNGIVGVKSTYGIVPVDGVVPACRSYDCVTAFARDLASAVSVTAVMAGPSALSPTTRPWPADAPLAAPPHPRVAVPGQRHLTQLSPARRALFAEAVGTLRARGVDTAEIDLDPFLDCARLLYGGALVAERYAAFGDFLATHPDGADPTVRGIVTAAADHAGHEVVRDQAAIAGYRVETAAALEGFDALLIPTVPTHPTLAEVVADPVGTNSRLGTYTNFMNLLDLSGVAVPAGRTEDGHFGVTVVARTFEDQVAIDIAGLLCGDTRPPVLPSGGIELAVFGAHLSGEPLNPQLVALGARLVGPVSTTADYRMLALPTRPAKPGVVPSPGSGVELPAEIWLLPVAGLGRFLAALPQPMSLGRMSFDDGVERLGFLCAAPSGEDISAFGGWRAYRLRTHREDTAPAAHDDTRRAADDERTGGTASR